MLFQDDDTIRVRAHELWLRDGRPDGRALDHWLEAQHEAARFDPAAPWFDRAYSGNEFAWMRCVLWSPQPFTLN